MSKELAVVQKAITDNQKAFKYLTELEQQNAENKLTYDIIVGQLAATANKLEEVAGFLKEKGKEPVVSEGLGMFNADIDLLPDCSDVTESILLESLFIKKNDKNKTIYKSSEVTSKLMTSPSELKVCPQSSEGWLEAVRTNPKALLVVPECLKTHDMFMEAVKQDGMMLQHIESKDMSEHMIITAINQNIKAVSFIPDRLLTEGSKWLLLGLAKATKTNFELQPEKKKKEEDSMP